MVKMRVEEEAFEVTGCSSAPMTGASTKARQAREAGSAGLFHGFRFCLLVSFYPPRSQIVWLNYFAYKQFPLIGLAGYSFRNAESLHYSETRPNLYITHNLQYLLLSLLS